MLWNPNDFSPYFKVTEKHFNCKTLAVLQKFGSDKNIRYFCKGHKFYSIMTSTKSTSVTPGAVVSANVTYTNKDNADRKFDISAEISIQKKKVVSVNSGSIVKKDSVEGSNGNFNCGQNFNHFGFNSNGMNAEEIKEAIAAITAFVSDVEKNVESSKDSE